MTDENAPEPGLETRMDRLEHKLDELLGHVSKPDVPPAGPEGRPPTIEEQVRAELDRAEQEKSAAAKADADKQEQETMAQRLARLEEKVPLPPQPRRQKFMWGSR